MLNNFEDIWFLTISQLQSIYQKSAQKYERLHKQILHMESVLIEKKEKLSSLNREIAVTDRRIKDNGNYIFQINKKNIDRSDAFDQVMTEFKKKETKLFEVKKEQHVLETKIEYFQEGIPKTLNELADIEAQNKTDTRRCKELEKEKEKLSDEISAFLSNTSIQREDFENKAEELNNIFIQNITDRSAVNNRLKQVQKKNEEIRTEIEELKKYKPNIDDIKILKASIPLKEQENQTLETSLTALQEDVSDKRKTLDVLMAEVNAQEKKLSLIDDGKVIRFDTVLSEFNQRKTQAQKNDTEIEQSMDGIFDLIVEKNGLEENSAMILKRLDSLEKDLLGCVEDNFI